MEYLPYWDISDKQKLHFKNVYRRKYGYNKNEKSGYTFSRFYNFVKKDLYFSKYDAIKEMIDKNAIINKDEIILLIKNSVPPHKHQYLPYIYYYLTDDPNSLWSSENDKSLLEIFNFASMITFKQKIGVSHFFLLESFMKLLKMDNWVDLLSVDYRNFTFNNSCYFYRQISQIFGWPLHSNFIEQKKNFIINFKNKYTGILLDVGFKEIMISDILDVLLEYHHYYILK